MPDVTPELRQKIEDLLALTDKKLLPDQFSGFAQTGLRYQSNASLGAGSQTVLASGGTLNSNFVARPDWNWFGTVGFNYVHDFQTQTGETFEASVIAYDAQQFSLHQFDIGLLEIRAGPRFALSPGDINGLTVKPYVVATGATLADAPYTHKRLPAALIRRRPANGSRPISAKTMCCRSSSSRRSLRRNRTRRRRHLRT